MRIQTNQPIVARPAPARTAPAENAPQPAAPQDQVSVSAHPLRAAALQVSRSGLSGAFEGVGLAYLACLGGAIGPAAGLGVRIGLMGLGAAVGAKKYGPVWKKNWVR